MSFARKLDLTEEDAEEIRHSRTWDERTFTWLADKWGYSKSTMRHICNGWYRIDNDRVVLTGQGEALEDE